MEKMPTAKNRNLGQDFKELGVSFKNYSSNSTLQLKAKRFNCKLKIYREFVLATLSTLAKERKQSQEKETSSSQFYALDAYSCTGVAAIQWKKHLQEDVHVTAADHDDVSLLIENVENNSLSCRPWHVDPCRVPGDPKTEQARDQIFTCRIDARALMTMEAYNFIYLSPFKGGSTCLEPAFHSLSSGGVMALVVQDLSIFARAPHVVRRSFSAEVIKTEYLKEMAARIVLAEAARSSAKYSKGISVLYVVSQDDFLLIALRVQRGQKSVDSSLANVAHLLHCRFCEERVFLPNQLAPHDNPYSHLSCLCRSKNVGKTAVILGPMWKGRIFDTSFLDCITEEGSRFGLSAKFFETVSVLSAESKCASSPGNLASEPLQKPHKSPIRRNENSRSDSESSQFKMPVAGKPTELSERIPSPSEVPFTAPAMDEVIKPSHPELDHNCDISPGKRKQDLTREESPSKRQKKDAVEETPGENVPFYYNVSRSKKGVSHKLNKLVTLLQNSDHRASRTHFDPCAIRTSAGVHQFVQLLE